MSSELLHSLLGWLQNHQYLAYLIVFITALTESLALVGLLVPGAILMVIFGTLIATGHLEFSSVYIAACLGAIMGDNISYWLGKYYQQQLNTLWPLNRHPELIEKGKKFFQKHGGKSILLGRFIGPIRPIIPSIAGMMEMPLGRFTIINFISALLWAPIYLLPGILIGASLGLASELAGRFGLLLLLLLFLLWFSFQVIRYLYNKITPHTDRMLYNIINWIQNHPFINRLTGSLFDPQQREIRGLSLWVLVLFISSLTMILLSTYTFRLIPIHNVNNLVFQLVANIQSPPFNWFLEWFTTLGDIGFLLLVVTLFSLWFSLHKNWPAIVYLLSAWLIPTTIIAALSLTHSPPEAWQNNQQMIDFYLPSGHTAVSLSVYGFIAIMIAPRFSIQTRFIIYISITWLIGIIGFTRLYFASHLLTDVIAGMSLGLAWLSVLAIAFRSHHRIQITKTDKLISIGIIIILLASSYPYQLSGKPYPEIAFEKFYVMTEKAWLDTGWQSLPAYRQDLKGSERYPLDLQWKGEINKLVSTLEEFDWQAASFRPLQLLQLFNPAATPDKLPLIAHVHDGRYDDIRLYKTLTSDSLLVLRLWKTDTIIKGSATREPLWIGNVTLVKQRKAGLLSYLYTTREFNQPVTKLVNLVERPSSQLNALIKEYSQHRRNINWDGRILLLE